MHIKLRADLTIKSAKLYQRHGQQAANVFNDLAGFKNLTHSRCYRRNPFIRQSQVTDLREVRFLLA